MSIYVNLRSSECKDIYSKNHGGNFSIELNEPLRLQGGWEVALAEMTYHAQAFPNLPAQYATVTVSSKRQLEVYDTKDKDFSIKTWVTHNGGWVLPDSDVIAKDIQFPHTTTLPKQNYTWEDFKQAMANITKTKEGIITNLRFTFTDISLKCEMESDVRTCIEYSNDLVNFLSLKYADVYAQPGIREFEWNTPYTKPKLAKETPVLWDEDTCEELWLKIDDVKIDIPQINTKEKFIKAIANLTKGTMYEKLISFEVEIWREESDQNGLGLISYGLLCKMTEDGKDLSLQWSPALQRLLRVKEHMLITYGFSGGKFERFHVGDVAKKNYTPSLLTVSKNLGYNYYPTAKTMIDALNEAVVELSGIINSKPIEPVFGINIKGICTYTEHPKYRITLSSYLLKLLHLPDTSKSQPGTAFFVMPTSTREFLYIHSDMLDSHSYNNETNVLRVINNDRAVNEKVMVSFQNLYYYPISARYLSNIQIRITDNHSDEDLPFDLEVTCLLHFRRCSNLPSS